MSSLHVRDAVESDADGLATLANLPADVVRDSIHDRAVSVAERPPEGEEAENGRDSELAGFVSFDARDDVVHVTQFGGSPEACERLLEEPVRFAENEGMEVEIVVTASDDSMRTAVEAVGFEKRGSGPMFEGERTVRYRLSPDT
ncbi:hypothetical protein SAMN04487950_3631 [Halogranum rubrum]|uniref:N-acetyltransferase domain-containing protein n=1 Tax=Halogranum rubrum TaxID=553466 RepID=A0A1I4HBR0_9EURY|nr:hypothetical protein [Halogranum rubrum]SFL39644.1 hypothetical protein SAMN04487950_3631 [Halogranum rubrum]